MIDIKSMILSEVCDLEFKDFTTQKYLGTANELQDMSIANSQDDTYALGKNEAKLAAFSKNKGMKLTGTSGQFEQFLIGLQTGSGVTIGENDYEMTEVLTVAENAIKVKYNTKAILNIDVMTANGNVDTTKILELAEAVTEGKYTFTPATGAIAFFVDELADGTKVRVSYKTVASGSARITNDLKTFSKVVSIVGNTVVLDGCDNTEYLAQLVIPKAKVSGTFNIDLSGEPAVQSFEIECMSSCGQSKLWDLLVVEDEGFTAYPLG